MLGGDANAEADENDSGEAEKRFGDRGALQQTATRLRRAWAPRSRRPPRQARRQCRCSATSQRWPSRSATTAVVSTWSWMVRRLTAVVGAIAAVMCIALAAGLASAGMIHRLNRQRTRTKVRVTALGIAHWNGVSWKAGPSAKQRSAAVGGLSAVGASSSADAWGVGQGGTARRTTTFTVHWNGRVWRTVRSPSPDSSVNVLNGVVAISAGDAWAVGWDNYVAHLLIEHRTARLGRLCLRLHRVRRLVGRRAVCAV